MICNKEVKDTFDLDTMTLGPDFKTQTKESFVTYVNSLKEIKELDRIKLPREPRVKKEPLVHDFDETSKTCRRCQKKVRSPGAKCQGAGASEKNLTEAEKTLAL